MVLPWKEVHSMVMRRLAQRQMETMTHEERVARAKKARAAQKWRPNKNVEDSSERPVAKRSMNKGKSPQK